MSDLAGLGDFSFEELKHELSIADANVARIKQEMRRRAKDELDKITVRANELAAFVADAEAEPNENVGKTKAHNSGIPKYQHPENAEITWTGRGKKPKWMQRWILDGKDPNNLLISDPSRASGEPSFQPTDDEANHLDLAA